MIRTRLKTIFLRFTIVLTLLIILFVFFGAMFFYQQKRSISDKLVQKKFIAPTEYYYYPLSFEKNQITDLTTLDEQLQTFNYRKREQINELREDDYALVPIEKCLDFVNVASDDAFCLGIRDEQLKILTLSSDGKISKIYKLSSGALSQEISRESFSEADFTNSRAKLLAEYINGIPILHKYISISDTPTACLNSIMAIEDPKFLDHQGISIKSIFRAFIKNLLSGRKAQGGSTLTQQMVKNYFLSSEKTYVRKLKEIMMSLILETQFTKDEILETYLNIIYMGQNGPFQIIGYAAASNHYFQKPLQDLNLSECALLSAIINNPGTYNPFTKPENAQNRKKLVLEKMLEHNLIAVDQANEATALPLPSLPPKLPTATAPYYIDAVNKQATDLGINVEGKKIFTAININSQLAGQNALQNYLKTLEERNPKIRGLNEQGLSLEGVLLSVRNQTGLVTTVIGGRNYKSSQFNRALNGHRQVGSIMKPLVYLTALKEDHKPTELINDEFFSINYEGQSWSPENYGKQYYGEVPYFYALKMSLNSAAARIADSVGLKNVIKTARNLNIKSDVKPVPSLSLGAFELFPIEVLGAYSTLARMGHYTQPSFIIKILDEADKEIYTHQIEFDLVEDEKAVAELVGMMKQTVISGTAPSVAANGLVPSAGKTGTTNDYKDSWFAGFSPYITSVVWVGYDSNITNFLTGASGALPIWIDFMKYEMNLFPRSDFYWPSGVRKETLNEDQLKSMNAIKNEKDSTSVELIIKD